LGEDGQDGEYQGGMIRSAGIDPAQFGNGAAPHAPDQFSTRKMPEDARR
jgi:hypothetical protein